MYKVVKDFKDLKDGGYIYRAGDEYPRSDAKKPTAERIQELASNKNKTGKKLIEEVEEPKIKEPIMPEPVDVEEAPKPKPKRKKKNNVGANTEDD